MSDPKEYELIEQACQFEQRLRRQRIHSTYQEENELGPVESIQWRRSTKVDPNEVVNEEIGPFLDDHATSVGGDPYELQMAKKALLFLNEVRVANTIVAQITDARGDHNRSSTENETRSLPGPYSAPPLPNQLGRYEILSLIGQGGFADVYLARDPSLDRLVALKIPRPHFLIAETSRRRFEREARAAATLGHPQIVPVFEFGELAQSTEPAQHMHGLSYIAFEYIPGSTLAEWLAQRESPTVALEAAAIVQRLAEVIEHAHQRGIVHRDLKPSNILIDRRNTASQTPLADQLRIADFGLAKHDTRDESLLTIEGMAIGTPAYMSPEQAQGSTDVGLATDIYALGMILYELLTKQLPFKRAGQLATLQAVTSEPARPIRQSRPDVCRGLDAICMKCLAKEPELRYASAFALSEDLRDWREGRPIVARQTSVLQKLFQWTKRNPPLAGALVTTLASLGLGLGIATWKYREAAEHLAAANQQRGRAERHLERIERIADDILGDLAFELRTAPHMDSVRREVMRKALALQTALIDEEPNNDLVRARTIKALLRTTELMRQMGDATASTEHISSALRLAEQVAPHSKQFAETQYLVAEFNNHRARLCLDRSEYDAARTILEQSRDVASSLDFARISAGRVPMMAELHRLLGMAYEGEANFELAEEAYRVGIRTIPESSAAHPSEATYLQALLANSLAVLYNRTGRVELALQTYLQASKLLSKLLEEHPQRLDFKGLAATVAFNIGNHHSRSQNWQMSEEHFRIAQQNFAKLRLASPEDVLHLRNGADVTGMLASSLAHLKRYEEAKSLFSEALELIERCPELERVRELRLRHSNNYARMLAEDLGDTVKAREIFAQVVASVESQSESVEDWNACRSLAFACKKLGEIDERANCDDPTAGRNWYEKQLHYSMKVLSQNPEDRNCQSEASLAHAKLAGSYLSERKFDLARMQADQIAKILPDVADLFYRAAREHAKLYLRMKTEESLLANAGEHHVSLLKINEHMQLARKLSHPRLNELLDKDPIWKLMSNHLEFASWLEEFMN